MPCVQVNNTAVLKVHNTIHLQGQAVQDVKLYRKISVCAIDKDDSVCEPVGMIVLFV